MALSQTETLMGQQAAGSLDADLAEVPQVDAVLEPSRPNVA